MNNSFNSIVEKIEEQLLIHVQELSVIEKLRHAYEYALFPKGKRLRPLLALAVVQDCGANINDYIRVSLPLELIHASSLVHDDLPALDNDDFRRGKPSCHKAFGEATAILVGDLLIAQAFSIISSNSLEKHKVAELTKILAQSFSDLCHGQQRDLLDESLRGDLNLLHLLKTGSLFRAAAEFGAVFADCDHVLLKHISSFGEQLGVYFQVVDDLLDLTEEDNKKGRPAGSDQRNNRKTYGSSFSKQELTERLSLFGAHIEESLVQIEKKLTRPALSLRGIYQQISSAIS
jgi:geranylgeranyl diphosphate synthase, type II